MQCENCHGSGVAHVANPGDESVRPTVNLAATLCGSCHTDAHHPTFDEWQLSKHAVALPTLQANTHATDECLQCHSLDYRYAVEQQAAGGGDDEIPTLATAQLSLDCATCHDPHGGTNQAAQLHAPVATLCGECHTQGPDTLPGNTPHHPQLEVLTGTGAFNADDTALALPFDHSHTSLVGAAGDGEACGRCHVVRHEVEEPNEGNPNVTGHTFNPFDESISAHQADQYTGCAPCHDAAGAAARRTSLQSDIEGRLAGQAPFFDAASASYLDPAALSEADQTKLATAKFNWQFVSADGSRGVHNPSYARAALDVVDGILTDLQTP